jgi:hypothetical protein
MSMKIKVSLHTAAGISDRIVSSGRSTAVEARAANAAIYLILDAGELRPGDKLIVTEVEQ